MKKIILVFIIAFLITRSFFLSLIISVITYFVLKKINTNSNNKMPFYSEVFPDVFDSSTFFAKALFATMGHISKSKGRVTENDIQLAQKYMSKLNLRTDELALESQDAFIRGTESTFPLNRLLEEFYKLFENHEDILSLFIDIQLDVAYSDGSLHNNEKKILLIIINEFGFSISYLEEQIKFYENTYNFDNQYQEHYNKTNQNSYENSSYNNSYKQKQQSSQSSSENSSHNNSYKQKQQSSQSSSGNELLVNAYKVLGVKSSDDYATVKASYRKLMNQYHPDKFAVRKIPKEFHEVYREKAKQIVNSYQLICEYKKWK